MEIIKNQIFMLLICFSSFCQTIKKEDSFTRFEFNRASYNKIAIDSIKSIYQKQLEYYTLNQKSPNLLDAISLKYKFDDLSFISLPIYKLDKKKVKKYKLKNNFESFIDFNDSLKEQTVLILNLNKEIICVMDIPNFEFKKEILVNDKLIPKLNKQDYENFVLKKILDFPEAFPFRLINLRLKEKPNSLFFRILGFRFEIFEIDLNTGELFVNYFSSSREPRLEVNEYVEKYIDKRVIHDIANNIFDKSYIKRKKREIQEIKM